ncbi:MAG: sugar phosphate nucleotidyltransferase [Candidatus Micrarchaeia archaeon]
MSLERVTVTLDKPLLSRIDARVDGLRLKNRSHAVNHLLRRALSAEDLSKALVLAGSAPNLKSLELVLLRLKAFGIFEVYLALSKGGEAAVSRFHDGAALGMELNYLWDEGKGSALALRNAAHLFREEFVLSYADVLYPGLDLEDLHRFHELHGGACTLALASVSDPHNYGVAKLSGSRIIDFQEKPKRTSSYLINAGIAVCDPRVFSFISPGMKRLEEDLLPVLASRGELYGYAYSGEWKHLG